MPSALLAPLRTASRSLARCSMRTVQLRFSTRLASASSSRRSGLHGALPHLAPARLQHATARCPARRHVLFQRSTPRCRHSASANVRKQHSDNSVHGWLRTNYRRAPRLHVRVRANHQCALRQLRHSAHASACKLHSGGSATLHIPVSSSRRRALRQLRHGASASVCRRCSSRRHTKSMRQTWQ